MALAITSGLAALPPGSSCSQAANISAGADRVMGVSVKPGATELTAIWRSRSSRAQIQSSRAPGTPAGVNLALGLIKVVESLCS
jgi:hypothetical protein